jgi:hypothetical protein
MNRRKLFGLLAGCVASATLAVAATAAISTLRGNVLSVNAQEKSFRVKTNDGSVLVATTSGTVFRFTTGATATFADVKVGRYTESTGTASQGKIVAQRVTIRK